MSYRDSKEHTHILLSGQASRKGLSCGALLISHGPEFNLMVTSTCKKLKKCSLYLTNPNTLPKIKVPISMDKLEKEYWSER